MILISNGKNLEVGRGFKYATKNPIGKYLIRNFFTTIQNLISEIQFKTVLDAGCGEGLLLANLQEQLRGKRICGVDIDPVQIKSIKRNLPNINSQIGNIYSLPFSKSQFDLVICTETLEHLENYDLALEELKRVAKKFCLLSVPNEPIWRILNMSRGAYLTDFGNTRGHVNHWSRNSFEKLVGKYFSIVKVETALPWTAILASIKK